MTTSTANLAQPSELYPDICVISVTCCDKAVAMKVAVTRKTRPPVVENAIADAGYQFAIPGKGVEGGLSS